jgi:hypothetical protein
MAGKPIQVTIEDAELIFRNFKGEAGMYNEEGQRSFAVIIDPEVAQEMMADGWNVKRLRPREEDGEEVEGAYYVSVSVSYKMRPPHIVLINSRARTVINEDSVETLDWVDIKTVDLTINGSHWSNNNGSGIKAYLKAMYLTIEEDALALKYAGEEV